MKSEIRGWLAKMTTTAEKINSGEKIATVETTTEKATSAADKPVLPRKALGRGLESLLPGGLRTMPGLAAPRVGVPGSEGSQAGADAAAATAAATALGHSTVLAELHAEALRRADGHAVLELALDHIDANPYQTRSHISKEELHELAESIRANGVIQPIVVRPASEGRYVLITGERRTQASKLAGKEKIPAIVRHVSDQQAAEMTIVENLQREDLNCYEQAHAFARLSQDFKMTQEEIGKRIGCDRSTVSNYMRLLKLPAPVQYMLRDGWLDFSQARCLLTLAVPEHVVKLAKEAVEKHLSVEQLETLVIRANYPVEGQEVPAQAPRRGARWVDPNVKAAQRELERILGVRVKIRDRKGKGKIVIEYSTLEDFDRVLEMLKGKSGS
jgi:ParB family transcriptional regulator, chromosome partitioning protein